MVAVVLQACGRIAFDASAVRDGASARDAAIDVTAAELSCLERHAGVLVCDDFEAGLVGWGEQIMEDAVLAVTQAMSRSGRQALEVRQTVSSPAPPRAFARHLIPPIATGPLFLRVYLYLPAGSSVQSYAAMVKLERTGGSYATTLSARPGDRVQADILARDGGYNESSVLGVLPRGRWVCLESELLLADAAGGGVQRTHVDGVLAVELGPGIDTIPGEPYDSFWIGLWLDAPEEGVIVYFDDLVVAGQRPGCD